MNVSYSIFLQLCFLQIALERRVLERHDRVSEISRLERVPRSVRQALVRNQGLLAALCGRERQLVVEREEADVFNQRARAVEVR